MSVLSHLRQPKEERTMAVNASKKRDHRYWRKWRRAGALGKFHIQKLYYVRGMLPADYVCTECGATNCKLWRRSHTIQPKLVCAVCAAKDQNKDISTIDRQGTIVYKHGGRTDNIGCYVPAIPTPGNNAYWGYTSVPKRACIWWDNLPTLPPQKSGGNKPRVTVVYEYTTGSHKGIRFIVYECSDEIEQLRQEQDAPDSLTKIVATGISDEQARALCDDALLHDSTISHRVATMANDPDVSPEMLGIEASNLMLAAKFGLFDSSK
jgi:hypothetical protein